MEDKTPKAQDDIDWENRTLCSDGNCIGVIGPDGCCKECGLRYEGELPAAAPQDSIDTATVDPEPDPPPDEVGDPDSTAPESGEISDDEWENRRLCVDGNCIGIIGPDGKCKECGLPAEP